MANAHYNAYKQSLLTGSPDLSALNIKAVLVDADDYTFSAAHTALSDIPAGARVATSANLAGKTVVNGAFDADDISLGATVTGDVSEAIVLYIDSGVEATSTLLCYLDTGYTSLPFTPNGGPATIVWGASIFFF